MRLTTFVDVDGDAVDEVADEGEEEDAVEADKTEINRQEIQERNKSATDATDQDILPKTQTVLLEMLTAANVASVATTKSVVAQSRPSSKSPRKKRQHRNETTTHSKSSQGLTQKVA